MAPKTDGSEDRWLRRQKLDLSNALCGNDLPRCDGQPAVDWECAECHTCQKSSLHGSIQDDKLDVLIEAWPRLSETLQAAIAAIFDSPELALRIQNPPQSKPSSRKTLPDELEHHERLAHLLAHRCRSIIQSCFREEEWIDIDQVFFAVILDGIRNGHRNSSSKR